VCEKCAFVLYEGELLKAPYEIIEEYEGKCPRCGKKLSYIPRTVQVRALKANA
jgi:DNA-directed RNA polymerase subunit RPC12/RpoP